MVQFVLSFVFSIFALGASGLSLITNITDVQIRSGAAFMVVSGITGKQELCLSVETGEMRVRSGFLFSSTKSIRRQ